MTRATIALALLLVSSCELYRDSPQWRAVLGPPEQAVAAARAQGRTPGTIKVGDTPAYVRQQWGPPADVDRMSSAYGSGEWWWYEGGSAVHFTDGKVDSIHN